LEIILLGSGTAVPSPGRTPAAVLLVRQLTAYLLDIGPGAIHKMAARGIDPTSLQYIFLTHLHSDHTLDLATFLQMNDSNPEMERTLPVFLTGPRGTTVFYNGLMSLYPGIAPHNYPFTIKECEASQFELGEVRISTAFTHHTPTSLAYRFDFPEGSLVYTGDCADSAIYAEDTALVDLCSNVDILICECSFPAGWPGGDHLNASDAGQLAARAHVGQLVLTHLYPPAGRVDIAAQAGVHYTGTVCVAADDLSLSLPSRNS